jgi:Na+/H+-dicarboxylate symporter
MDMIPQMIVILLMTFSLGLSIAEHGKKRKRENGWASLIGYLLWAVLLLWAGFFDVF